MWWWALILFLVSCLEQTPEAHAIYVVGTILSFGMAIIIDHLDKDSKKKEAPHA